MSRESDFARTEAETHRLEHAIPATVPLEERLSMAESELMRVHGFGWCERHRRHDRCWALLGQITL